MKLRDYFNQTKVATITVGENAVIGDQILSVIHLHNSSAI